MKKYTTTVVVSDDLGSAGDATTVRFGFAGKNYEIDLNKRNADTFERHMQRWIAAGRERATYTDSPTEALAIRMWAQERSIQLGKRGRIPAEVIEQYRDEMSKFDA